MTGRARPFLRRLRRGTTRFLHRHVRVALRAAIAGRRARALAPVAARCAGLRPIAAAGIAPSADGTIRPLDDDAWIELLPDRRLQARAPFGLLTIAAPAGSGRLLVDLGDGFAEARGVRFDLAEGRARLLLADLAHVARLRWAFGQAREPARPTLALEPIRDAAALEAALRGALPDATAADALLPLYARGLGRGRRGERFGALPDALALERGLAGIVGHDYAMWLLLRGTPSAEDRRRLAARVAGLATRFSFVVPTWQTPPALLDACLRSLRAQTYPHFEICIADDASSDPEVAATIRAHAAEDGRVRVVLRDRNGHISAASNSALALATGDYVVLVDHDDLLPDDALAIAAAYADAHPHADIFYSDEDKIGPDGARRDPYHKGGFDRFLLYGHNMVSHLGVYRRSLVEAVGGFREGLEGSQDYDLLLRCLERCGDEAIVHIPHILYHWRQIPGSTAVSVAEKAYAPPAARRAIAGHFERAGVPLAVAEGFVPAVTAVVPRRPPPTPLSLIVAGGPPAWTNALAGVPGVEIVVAADAGAASLNGAAARAGGELIGFLDGDAAPGGDCITRVRALLAIADVGAVGGRIVTPGGRLRHMGYTLGMGRDGIADTPCRDLPVREAGYVGKALLMRQVSAASRACLFLRRRDFLDAGGFDPALGGWWDDVDLCLRLRARGLRIVHDPAIAVVRADRARARAGRAGAAATMRARWGGLLTNDPFWSPHHDLEEGGFALAPDPRIAPPWALPTPERSDTP